MLSLLLCVCLWGHLGLISALLLSPDVVSALRVLEDYDRAYLQRITEGKGVGLSPAVVEFRRAQVLKKDGLLREKELLRESIQLVSKNSDSIIFGIMSDSGERAIDVLRAWTKGLDLPRKVLTAVDDLTSAEIEVASLGRSSVYVKYDSKKQGDAYMKRYTGDFSGVIFQPMLPDTEFRQYGNFPISLFT